jgi:hypothetical protein
MKKNTKKFLKVVAVIAVVNWLFKKPANAMDQEENNFNFAGSGNRPNFAAELTPENIKENFRKIYRIYGREKTKRLEQMYRNETAHFKSGQFKTSFSPGMESVPNNAPSYFPFGWSSLKQFAEKYNIPASSFYQGPTLTEGGTGKPKRFVGFPTLLSAMMFVMFVIEKRGWNFGKWYSFNENLAQGYLNHLDKIRTPFVDSF